MRIHTPRATNVIMDSVLQGATNQSINPAQSTLSTKSVLNLLGMGNGFSGYSEQAIVPDTNGAVGPTQFVQWVNESFAVFSKSSGSVTYGPTDGNTLWQALGAPCVVHNATR